MVTHCSVVVLVTKSMRIKDGAEEGRTEAVNVVKVLWV